MAPRTNLQTAAESLQIVRGPHEYNEDRREYYATPPSMAQYPKMLYHPEFGKKPAPKASDFVILPGMTAEQQTAILKSFSSAMEQWRRQNRMKIANSKAEEAILLKKGWLLHFSVIEEIEVKDDDEI